MRKLIILMAIFSLFLVWGVSAHANLDCNITVPTTITEGSVINVTYNISNADATAISVTAAIWAKSTSTANSTYVLLVTVANTTGQLYVNWTVPDLDKIILEDSNDYTFNATCTNGTLQTAAGEVISKTVDRTKPDAATTTSADDTKFDSDSSTTYASSVSYTINGSEVAKENTTGVRIAFLDVGAKPRFTGTNTFAMSCTATDTCSYTFSDATIPNGMYDVYVQTYDGTNSTISARKRFEVSTFPLGGATEGDVAIGVGKIIAQREKLKQAGFIILVFGAIYYFFVYKGNKRR